MTFVVGSLDCYRDQIHRTNSPESLGQIHWNPSDKFRGQIPRTNSADKFIVEELASSKE